jgi:hypothetical protein
MSGKRMSPEERVGFVPPASRKEAREQLRMLSAELTAQIMELQGQLSALKDHSLPTPHWQAKRKQIIIKMRPLELRRQLLNVWIREQLNLRKIEVEGRVKVLGEKADPTNPMSVLFHGRRLLRRLIKEFELVLRDDDWEIIDAMESYLQKNGYQ